MQDLYLFHSFHILFRFLLSTYSSSLSSSLIPLPHPPPHPPPTFTSPHPLLLFLLLTTPTGKKPFFNWISADGLIATARGAGGGLALWQRDVELEEKNKGIHLLLVYIFVFYSYFIGVCMCDIVFVIFYVVFYCVLNTAPRQKSVQDQCILARYHTIVS